METRCVADNGSFALRQPHTSNATEALFSQQLTKHHLVLAQSQGAILTPRLVVLVHVVVFHLPQHR